MVELRGFEPLTFCMPCSTILSDDVALGPVTALQSRFSVWLRLVGSGGIWGRWCLVWYWLPDLQVTGGLAMALRIMEDAMTLKTGNRAVATARFSEHTATDGNGAWIVSTHPPAVQPQPGHHGAA